MLGTLLGLPEGAIKASLRWASQFFCIYIIIVILGGLLLALHLSEERDFSCIDQTVRLGPLPFVWKSFPNTCGTLLGRPIGTG